MVILAIKQGAKKKKLFEENTYAGQDALPSSPQDQALGGVACCAGGRDILFLLYGGESIHRFSMWVGTPGGYVGWLRRFLECTARRKIAIHNNDKTIHVHVGGDCGHPSRQDAGQGVT